MLNELIRQCRSVRRFDITNPVEPSVLSQILECVSALPSAANLQRIRYAAVAGDRALSLFSGISLGGYLPVDKKPTPDVAPTAYIVLFAEQRESDPNLFIDIGIAAEAISLSARELTIPSMYAQSSSVLNS